MKEVLISILLTTTDLPRNPKLLGHHRQLRNGPMILQHKAERIIDQVRKESTLLIGPELSPFNW
jgi:hypothetical protein